MTFINENISLEKCPALVLNADYRPLSYYPLSLWNWQDSIKSAYLDRVTIVNNYDRIISCAVLEHLEDLPKYLYLSTKKLKKSGFYHSRYAPCL